MNREELKTAIAEIAAQAGVSANGRSAMAETIVRISEPNRLSLDIFNMQPTFRIRHNLYSIV
jgi:hypothetical protein